MTKNAEFGRIHIELGSGIKDTRTALETKIDMFLMTQKTVDQHTHQLD